MDETADGRQEPRPRRQRLGVELLRLRDQAGISGRDLAQRIGMSQSKVSRIETGAAIPSLPEVAAWAKAVGATAEARERLVELTESAFTEVHGWRAALDRRTHMQDEIEQREAHARLVRTFQPSVIPGLLQTADYARRVFSLFEMPYGDNIAAAVGGRLHRQLALYEGGRRFEFLITEAALRWRPGPPNLLLAQLDRVSSLSTLENVAIGLIPLRSHALAVTSHGFIIYDGRDVDEQTFVTVETIHADLIVNDSEDIGLYAKRWSSLHQMAIFDDDARRFLAELAIELGSEPE